MDFFFCRDIHPEDHENLLAVLDAFREETVTKKRAMTAAERQRKYRENKKLREANVTNVTDSVTDNAEEREEKRDEEGVLPPIPPSSPSSSPHPNNIPITPLPPFPEEAERKGEREDICADRPKITRHRYGEFSHVLLSDEEYDKLEQKFGDGLETWIKRLDEYLENNRSKHYSNHYLTILNWSRKEPKVTRIPEKRTYTFQEVLAMEREKEDQEIL